MKKNLIIYVLIIFCSILVYADNYGVICGISDYPGEKNDLKNCSKDAIAIYDTLTKKLDWKTENLKLLIDTQVTKQNLINAFKFIKSIMKYPSKDRFFFYFSGYMLVGDKDLIPIDEIDKLDEYLYLANDERFSDDDLSTWISYELFDTECNNMLPLNRFVLLDIYRLPNKENEILDQNQIDNIDIFDEFDLDFAKELSCMADSGVAITSCTITELVQIVNKNKSVSFYFNKALNGNASDRNNDGWISVSECYDYISQEIQNQNSKQSLKLFTSIQDNNLVKAPKKQIQPAVLKGDVNNDNKVDIADALLIASYSTGVRLKNFNKENADINCDTRIDIIDALTVIRKINDPTLDLNCPSS